MPSILVVEHEGRYIERIQEALSSEGWRPRFVAGRPEALRAAASEAPNLVLVNAELPGAPELLRAFARRHGGPGAVALDGERSQATGREDDADERLAKPFSDQELRLVVRRRLVAAEQPAPAAPAAAPSPADGEEDHKLTSQEIFGDLLAEVEGEVAPAPAPPSAVPAPVARAAEEPAAPPRAAATTGRWREKDDDVELRLERTLSGVPGMSSRRAAVPGGQAPPGGPAPPAGPGPPGPAAAAGSPALSGTAPSGTAARPADPPREPPPSEPPHREPPHREPPRQDPPPPAPLPPEPPRRDPDPGRPPQGDPPPERRAQRSLRPDSDDVDELLNMTLTGLDLGPRAGRRPAAASEAAAGGGPRSARQRPAEIDLSEIEALAGLGRRRAPRTGERPASGPPPLTAEPPSAPVGNGVPDEAGEAPPAADPGAPMAGVWAAGEAAHTEAAPDEAAPDETAPDELASSVPAPLADAPTEAARAEAGGPAPAEPEAVPAEGAPSEALPAGPAFPAPEGGRRFGHYTLLDRIAVGGMAEVWKARMSGVEGFQKTVAIKRILPHMNDDSDFVEMFIDEAKLAAQLNHPNITHIYDLGKIGDDFYIAMEYVDGRNLRAILNESRRKALPLPVGFGLVVASRLASALDHAHRKRDFDDRQLELVHRDVSPQNVLISIDGDIKLCDFGISKAVAKVSQTETGALKGKLQYMSPEQAWGRAVDARSDLFSLGALSFEMLTGERLFTGDSEISVLEAVRECRVRGPRQVNPAVPAGADAVVRKALAREPEDRFQTAGEMQQAIEEILYQLRPTPNQSDVAAFLVRLDQAPEVKPGSRAPGAATGTHAGSHSGSHTGGAEGSAAGWTGAGGEAGSAPGRRGTASGIGDERSGEVERGIASPAGAAAGSWAAGERVAEAMGSGSAGSGTEGSGDSGGGAGDGGTGVRGTGFGGTGAGRPGTGVGRPAVAPWESGRRQAPGGGDTASGGSRPGAAAAVEGTGGGGGIHPPADVGRGHDITASGAGDRAGREAEGADPGAGAGSSASGAAAAARPARRWWPFGRPERTGGSAGGPAPGESAGEAHPSAASQTDGHPAGDGAPGGSAGDAHPRGASQTDAHPAGGRTPGESVGDAPSTGTSQAGAHAPGGRPGGLAPGERPSDEGTGVVQEAGSGAATALGLAPAASGERRPWPATAGGPVPPADGEPPAPAATPFSPAASGPLVAAGQAATSGAPGSAAAADDTHGGFSTPPVEAIAARGDVPGDEASVRGRWLLISGILFLVVVLLLAWLWLGPLGTDPELAAPPDAALPTVTAAPEPGPAAPPPAGDTTLAGPDLEKLVDERLAETQEALRAEEEAKFEEQARRIREQIEALKRSSERPPAPPPAQPDPPPGDEGAAPTPPAAGASAEGGEGAGTGGAVPRDRLVSFGEAQYPAAARSPRHDAPKPAGPSRRG